MTEPAGSDAGRSYFVDGKIGRIHVRDFGGPGPVIVALHGVTGGTFLWGGVAKALAGQAHVIAMDFRGHGQSEWSDDRLYSTEAYTEDLEAVLASLALAAPPVLMGSSWGALAAIRVAAQRSSFASGLIVVDVEPSFDLGPTDVVPKPYKFPTFEAVTAWERKANPAAPDDVLKGFVEGSITKTADGTFLRRHDPFFLTHWPFRDDDLWNEVATVQCPVLVVNGDRTFVRREVCLKMARAFANGHFAAIENSGHLVPLEQPVRLAALISEFVQQHEKMIQRSQDKNSLGEKTND